jgi:tetratricopeptide (TPR) repeat protein
MFFVRLRTHAKWVFVVLAAAFAIGFLAFGVGAGGTGFGDAIADFFGGGDDTPTLAEAKAKVDENPTDTAALLELASLYEGQRQLTEAADTLKRYLELRPDDVDVLRQLSAVYENRVSQIQTQQGLLSALTGPESFNSNVFSFPNSTGFIGAVGQDPIVEAQATDTSAAVARLGQDLEAAYGEQLATYEQITELTPDDPQAFLLLGEAASQANENDKAIAAYERFLELDPENTLANSIQEQIDLLKQDVQVVNG